MLVQRTNRGAGAPILRGLIGPENLILFDGVRINNSTYRTGPNQYFSLVDPSSIESLEVMLGPGSVLYGSDALGGVAQAFPLEWWRRNGVGARGGARFVGSDASTSVWGSLAHSTSMARVMAGGAVRSFGTLRTGGGAELPLSGFVQGSWHAQAQLELGARSTLRLVTLGSRVRDAKRTDELKRGVVRAYDNDDELAYLEWRYRAAGGSASVRTVASVHRTFELEEKLACELAGCVEAAASLFDAPGVWSPAARREDRFKDEVWTPGVLVTAEVSAAEKRIHGISGIEVYLDLVASEAASVEGGGRTVVAPRGHFSDGSTYLLAGAFALVEGRMLTLGDHRVHVEGGLRASHVAAAAPNVPSLGHVEYTHTGVVGTASVRHSFGGQLTTYLTLAQGFRAPNLQESTVLGDTGSKVEVPNAELAPVKSTTLELGARGTFAAARFQAAGFVSLLRDIIDERSVSANELSSFGLDAKVLTGKPVVQRVNSASATYLGWEAELAVGPWLGLSPFGELAWVRGTIERSDRSTSPARRVPPILGLAGVRFETGPLRVESFARFAGAQDRLHPSDERDLRICEDPADPGRTYRDGGGSCPGTPGWGTLNLRATYTVDEHARLELLFSNLTDERYRHHGAGIDAPGRSVAFSMSGRY